MVTNESLLNGSNEIFGHENLLSAKCCKSSGKDNVYMRHMENYNINSGCHYSG